MNQEELHDLIATQQPNICQSVAYRNNEKVYSDCWNVYTADDCTHIMSGTKSIMALLIGIALDKGQIRSIDDKVLDYFPDYKVKRGEKTIYDVTIRHLLTMLAPYKCKGDPWTKVCSSDNWTFSSLDFLGGRKGLTDEFNYQTVCLHILTGILYRVTGMKTVDYANRYLSIPWALPCTKTIMQKRLKNTSSLPSERHPKPISGSVIRMDWVHQATACACRQTIWRSSDCCA